MSTSTDEFRWTWKFYENSPKPSGWIAYDTSRYDQPHKKHDHFFTKADGRVHVRHITAPNGPGETYCAGEFDCGWRVPTK